MSWQYISDTESAFESSAKKMLLLLLRLQSRRWR